MSTPKALIAASGPQARLVTRAQDMPLQGWAPPGVIGLTWHSLFDQANTLTRGLVSGIAISPPGDPGRRHRHAQAEFYYVLSGSGRVEIEGALLPVREGDAVHVPGDAWHRITNDGPDSLTILYVFPADSLDDVIYIFDETPDANAPSVIPK